MIHAVERNLSHWDPNTLTIPSCLEQSQQKRKCYLTASVLFCSFILRLKELTGGRCVCGMGDERQRDSCSVGLELENSKDELTA